MTEKQKEAENRLVSAILPSGKADTTLAGLVGHKFIASIGASSTQEEPRSTVWGVITGFETFRDEYLPSEIRTTAGSFFVPRGTTELRYGSPGALNSEKACFIEWPE